MISQARTANLLPAGHEAMEAASGAIRKPRLAVVATHPIQYQAPLWRSLAASETLAVKVFYADSHGTQHSYDPLYGQSFAWDVPLLDGYEYEILQHVRIPGLPSPTACHYPLGLHAKLMESRFDAVLIHGYMSGAAWAGYQAARRLRLPILLRGDSHLVGRRTKRMKGMIKRTLLQQFLRNVSCCIAIGAWNRDYWRHYGVPDERIATSLFAVDNDRFATVAEDSRSDRANLRAQWGVSENDVLFVFSGNFHPHKGIDVLLTAFSELRQRRGDVQLLLIGDGPERAALKAKAGHTVGVHWTGFVNQRRMPVLLAAGDVFVLPSYAEPWGLVINEAMASGLPCIVSSSVGAGPDLVSIPGTGRVFPAGDAVALRSAMEQACDGTARQSWKARIPVVLDRASYRDNARTILNCVRKSLAEV